MKLLNMQFSPTSCHFISLRSKYCCRGLPLGKLARFYRQDLRITLPAIWADYITNSDESSRNNAMHYGFWNFRNPSQHECALMLFVSTQSPHTPGLTRAFWPPINRSTPSDHNRTAICWRHISETEMQWGSRPDCQWGRMVFQCSLDRQIFDESRLNWFLAHKPVKPHWGFRFVWSVRFVHM
jgi:hypothetical protein